MSWGEFCTLLASIMPETPLGLVVNIRSENDKNILKNFTREQHRIRNEWRSRKARAMLSDPEEAVRAARAFQEMCRLAFG